MAAVVESLSDSDNEVSPPTVGSFVPRGTELTREFAFTTVLFRERLATYCDGCISTFKNPSNVVCCADCRLVNYCDKDCQAVGWTEHEFECEGLKKLPASAFNTTPEFILSAARMMCRIAGKLRPEKRLIYRVFMRDGIPRTFKDLTSHEATILADPLWRDAFMTVSNLAKKLMPNDLWTHSEAATLSIFGKYIVNNLPLYGDKLSIIGSGIFLGASSYDHSCLPTAVFTGWNRLYQIRTLEDIEDFQWDKVTICYFDKTLAPQAVRQELLKNNYFFHCQCRSCADEKRELMRTAIKCTFCPAGGMPYVELYRRTLPCLTCKMEISDPRPQVRLKVFQTSLSFLKEATSLYKVSYSSKETNPFSTLLQEDQVVRLHEILKDLDEARFHPLNAIRTHCYLLSFIYACNAGEYTEAIESGQEILNSVKHYYGNYHPFVGLVHLEMARMHVAAEEECDCEDCDEDFHYSSFMEHTEQATEIGRVAYDRSNTYYRKKYLPQLEALKSKMIRVRIVPDSTTDSETSSVRNVPDSTTDSETF